MSVLKEECGFILSRHLVKIHRNRLEHEGDSANCQYLLKNVFLHGLKKIKIPSTGWTGRWREDSGWRWKLTAQVFGLLARITIPCRRKSFCFSSECVTTHNLGKIWVILAVKVAIIAEQFPISSNWQVWLYLLAARLKRLVWCVCETYCWRKGMNTLCSW